MTRGQQIIEEVKRIITEAHKKGDNDPMADVVVTLSFTLGARWADSHPHWISVEDEMPPRWETNPNVSVPVITCKFINRELQDIDLQRYVFGESKWQYGDATHWMPFQFPEKGDEE